MLESTVPAIFCFPLTGKVHFVIINQRDTIDKVLMDMKDTDSRKRELHRICKEYRILSVYLFGSMAKEGAELLNDIIPDTVDSLADIDVGIVFIQSVSNTVERIKIYKKLYADLSTLFSPINLDLVFLQETGVILQFEAINGQLVYSHDEDQSMDYEEKVIKYYQDWKPDYDLYTKEVLEAIRS